MEALDKADNTLSLISQQCSDKFYCQESVYGAFLKFIKKHHGLGQIKIILEKQITKDDIKNNSFINRLLDGYKDEGHRDSLKVYTLKDNEFIRVEGKLSHMLLADEEGPYRFETHLGYDKGAQSEQFHNIRTDAVANFGDPDNSRKLWNFFQWQIENNTTEIPL